MNPFGERGTSAIRGFVQQSSTEAGMAPAGPWFGNGNRSVAAQAPLQYLIDFHSQKMTVAARATAERKTFGHLS